MHRLNQTLSSTHKLNEDLNFTEISKKPLALGGNSRNHHYRNNSSINQTAAVAFQTYQNESVKHKAADALERSRRTHSVIVDQGQQQQDHVMSNVRTSVEMQNPFSPMKPNYLLPNLKNL